MNKYTISQILNANIPDDEKNKIIAQELGIGNFEQPTSGSGFWSGAWGTTKAIGSELLRGLTEIPAGALDIWAGGQYLLGTLLGNRPIPQALDSSKLPPHLRNRFAFTPEEARKAIPKETYIPLTDKDISNFIIGETPERYKPTTINVNKFIYSQIPKPIKEQTVRDTLTEAGGWAISFANSMRDWVKKNTYEPKNLIEHIAGGIARAGTMFIDPEIRFMKYPMAFAGISFLKSYKGDNLIESLINAIESGIIAKAFKMLPGDTHRLMVKEVQKKMGRGMSYEDAVKTSMKESKPLQSAIKLATIQIIPPLTKTMKKIYEGKDITLQDISNLVQSGAFGVLWGYMASRTGDLGQLATELGAIGEGVSPKVRKQLEVMRRLTSYLPIIQEDLQNPEKDIKDVVDKIPNEILEERLPSDVIEQIKAKAKKEVKLPENIVTPEYLPPEIQEQVKREKGVVETIPFDKEILKQIKPAVKKTGKVSKNWLTEEEMRNLKIKVKEKPPEEVKQQKAGEQTSKETKQQGKTLLDILTNQPYEDNSIVVEANRPPKSKIEEQFKQETVKQVEQKPIIKVEAKGKVGIEEKPVEIKNVVDIKEKNGKVILPKLKSPTKLPEDYFYKDSDGNKKVFDKAYLLRYNDKEFVLNKEKANKWVLYNEPSEDGMNVLSIGRTGKDAIQKGIESLKKTKKTKEIQQTKNMEEMKQEKETWQMTRDGFMSEMDEGYGYKKTSNGHELKLVRAGDTVSHPSRGGTWFVVEKYEGMRPSYLVGQGQSGLPNIGGRELWRTSLILKRPYLFEVPEVKAEGEIPLKLYEKVTGKEAPKKGLKGAKAEQKYAKLEREISDTLKKQGYDGVILYNKIGVHKIPDQVFVLKDTKTYKQVIEQALKEGKSVPDEVLKDYPNLAKKYKQPAGGERGSIPVKAEGQQVEVGSTPTASTKVSPDVVSKLKDLGYKPDDIDKISSDKLGDIASLEIPKKNVSIKRNGDIKAFLPKDIENILNKKIITVKDLPIIKKTLKEKPQLQGIVLDRLMNKSYNGDVDFDIEKQIYPLIKDKNVINYTEQKYKPAKIQTQKPEETVNIKQNLNIPQGIKEVDNSLNNRISTIKEALNKNNIDTAKKVALGLSQDIDSIYNDLDKLPKEDFEKYFKKYRNWIDTIRKELGDKYSELISEPIKEEIKNENKIKEIFIDTDSLKDKDIDDVTKLAQEIDKLGDKLYFVANGERISLKDLVNIARANIGVGKEWEGAREKHLEGENLAKRIKFTLQRIFLNPRTVATLNKPLESFYKTGTGQIEEKNRIAFKLERLAKNYFNLKDKRKVNEALLVGDFLRKRFTDEELRKGIDVSNLEWDIEGKKFSISRLLRIRRKVIKLNDNEIKAYNSIRDTLDEALRYIEEVIDKMDIDENIKQEVKKALRGLIGYIPHERKGFYYVNVKNAKRETVFNTAVATEKQAILKINEFRKLFGDEYKFTYGLNEPTLSAAERNLISQDVIGKAIDAAIKNAIKRGTITEEQKALLSDIVSDEIHTGITRLLLQRGFGKRLLKRANIPGYDVNGLEYILGDYIRGTAGYVSKLKFSFIYAQLLANLRKMYPNNKSYISWARNYTNNMLRNLELSDKIGAYVQSALFIHYLGFRPMQFVLNVLQNFTNGMAAIRAEHKINEISATGKITKAMKDVITGNLTKEEEAMIQRGMETGELTPIMAREFIRSTSRMNAKWNRLLDVLGYFLEKSEEFNRKVMFLTDYRLQRLKGISTEEAYKHAIETTRMVHYHYGRANRYEWMAGGSTAQVTARTLMTFQTWGMHYLSYLVEGFKRYGFGEGMRMMFDSFLMFELLGGITATPYLWQMANAMGITRPLKRYMAENKKGIDGAFRRFLEYGLTGTLGVDLSSSLGVAFPSNFALLGVYKELQRAYNNADIDGIGRIFEAFYPRAINDLIKALRYVDKGVRNKYGTPLFKLEKGRQIPIKYNVFDTIVKILGGYPSHISRDLFVYYTAKGIVNYFDRKVRVLRIKMREAYNNRNMALYREYYKEYLQLLRQARQFGLSYGRQKTIKIKGLPQLPKIKLPVKISKTQLPFREVTSMPKNIERVERKLGY